MSLIEYDLIDGKIDRVKIAIDRLRAFEPKEGYYLAFSGGKDSVVIKKLADMAGVKYDAHFALTTVDPKAVIMFAKKYHPDVILEKPSITMWELIVKNKMPPTRMVRYCCRYLKEMGGDGRFVITGVRRAESQKRAGRKMVDICLKGGHKSFLHPIIDWSDRDVWEFIHLNKMPYCSLYDNGYTRVGCIGCPSGSKKQREKQFREHPGIKKAYINAFSKITNIRHKTGDEWFEWWMKDRKKYNPDQTIMFE